MSTVMSTTAATSCPSSATAPNVPPVSPVQSLFDDLVTSFPHCEGEGRFPVPGDSQDENGNWNETMFKLIGFNARYSDKGSFEDDPECVALSEPFMNVDFIRDMTGAAIVVYGKDNAEALRRYADEVQGLAFMTVPNPLGSGFMFLHMELNPLPAKSR